MNELSHFELTILNSLVRYPRIYNTAIDVAEHLFLTIGNGYEWFEGRLEPCGFSQNRIGPASVDQLKELFEIGHFNEVTSSSSKGEHYRQALFDGRRTAYLMYPKYAVKVNSLENPHSIYPYSSMAKIFNVPEDITEDWRKGICRFVVSLELCVDLNDFTHKELTTQYLNKLQEVRNKLDKD